MAARYVIVIFPDPADHTAAVERFRSRWDPLAHKVAAHITLVYPFQTGADQGALRQAAADVAGRHSDFPISFADPTIWDGEYLFLLARQGGEQVRRIHVDLYAALPDAHTTASFVPHVTIGRNGDPRELARARSDAQKQNLHVHGHARELSLYRVDPDGGRRVLFSLHLGQRA